MRRGRFHSVVWTFAPLIVGLTVAAALVGPVLRHVPHDLRRTITLLRALQDPDHRPTVVIFGNSVAMNGLDGAQLAEHLGLDAPAYNFASTGQTLPESYLYFQELPATTRDVIQVVSPPLLARPPRLAENVYNVFYLSGFRPQSKTRLDLEKVLGDPARSLFERGELAHRFQARWIVRQWIDTWMRSLIRGDLTLARATEDLFYPSIYSQPVSEAKLWRFLTPLRLSYRELDGLEIDPARLRLLEMMAESASARGARFQLLIAPVHPELWESLGDRFFDDLARLAHEGLGRTPTNVYDASRLLTAEEYVDHVHPTSAGADRLTAYLAEAMTRAR